MTLGGFLTAYTDEPPMRIASNDAVTGMSVLPTGAADRAVRDSLRAVRTA